MNSRFDNSRLADVYRRFTRRSPTRPLPDADALLALADGERSDESARALSAVAQSGTHADLLRFARALAPESARLGIELERALEAPMPAHVRAGHVSRRASPRPALRRIAAGIAASLVVVSAVWLVRQRHAPAPAPIATHASAASDRIFAATDASAQRSARDQIFRGEFARDAIFRAPFNG